MECDEISDVSFKTADFLSSWIEWMYQAYLIARLDVACVSGSLRERYGRCHAAFLLRAVTIWGRLRATSPGTTAMQRA